MDTQRYDRLEAQLRAVQAAQARAQASARKAWLLTGLAIVMALVLGVPRAGFSEAANSLPAQVAALQTALAQEQARAQAAETLLVSKLNVEIADRQQGNAAGLAGAQSYTDGKLSAETAARLQGDADGLAGARSYTDGKLAATLTAAQDYTDLLSAYIAPVFNHLEVRNAPGVNGAGFTEIYLTGANLHIVSGSGATDGPVNGLGNLIVGYNELRGAGGGGDFRTGSHNLVVGRLQNYTSYGGLVAGAVNEISGPFAAVSGGAANTASGQYASISGGQLNTASGLYASVSGGFGNTASGPVSFLSGGSGNTASGQGASVHGGADNTSTGLYASVSGGQANTASGSQSSVSGGRLNQASGDFSSILGGNSGQAGAPYQHIP